MVHLMTVHDRAAAIYICLTSQNGLLDHADGCMGHLTFRMKRGCFCSFFTWKTDFFFEGQDAGDLYFLVMATLRTYDTLTGHRLASHCHSPSFSAFLLDVTLFPGQRLKKTRS